MHSLAAVIFFTILIGGGTEAKIPRPESKIHFAVLKHDCVPTPINNELNWVEILNVSTPARIPTYVDGNSATCTLGNIWIELRPMPAVFFKKLGGPFEVVYKI
jgi:hypothetical protein